MSHPIIVPHAVCTIKGGKGSPSLAVPDGNLLPGTGTVQVLGQYNPETKEYNGIRVSFPFGTEARNGNTCVYIGGPRLENAHLGKVTLPRGTTVIPDVTKLKQVVPEPGDEFYFEKGTTVIVPKGTKIFQHSVKGFFSSTLDEDTEFTL